MMMKQGVNESCRIQPYYIYAALNLAQLFLQIDYEPAMEFFLVAQRSLQIDNEPLMQFHLLAQEEAGVTNSQPIRFSEMHVCEVRR